MKSWRKSSYSGDNSECVEIANTLDELRDSKNPNGPKLTGDVRSMVRAIRAADITH